MCNSFMKTLLNKNFWLLSHRRSHQAELFDLTCNFPRISSSPFTLICMMEQMTWGYSRKNICIPGKQEFILRLTHSINKSATTSGGESSSTHRRQETAKRCSGSGPWGPALWSTSWMTYSNKLADLTVNLWMWRWTRKSRTHSRKSWEEMARSYEGRRCSLVRTKHWISTRWTKTHMRLSRRKMWQKTTKNKHWLSHHSWIFFVKSLHKMVTPPVPLLWSPYLFFERKTRWFWRLFEGCWWVFKGCLKGVAGCCRVFEVCLKGVWK